MSSKFDETRYAKLIQAASQKVSALQTELDALKRAQQEPIAIVGMGCRLPQANNPEAFWKFLCDGGDAVGEIPPSRWDVNTYYVDDQADGFANGNRMYTRHMAALDQVDHFDPQFFGISPREAASMDPQQRLLLEVSWEALEHAGLAPQTLRRTQTGVFMGISTNDYLLLNHAHRAHTQDRYTSLGTTPSIAVGRIAHILGLQGPVMQLDTACSSSLVAVHLACQSLRNGEATLALAGGVNLILSPESMIALCQLQALSPDGRCKTFDRDANGYVRGEGCGVVVLKRLSMALADGDTIFGLIRGSAVNHDGPTSGLTVPNGPAQEQLLRQAMANAQVAPNEIGYIEAHGTGTALGDPIELGAIDAIFGERSAEDDPLWIGSVKTNIGHLEAAAGVAGLLKVILSLQHGEIPPHLHFVHPTPYVAWESSPVAVPTERYAWPKAKRLAGVSAFGFSGTNAHLILEAAPTVDGSPAAKAERPRHLFTLSAKSEQALRDQVTRYHALLATSSPHSLADLCYSGNIGRNHFAHRIAIPVDSVAQLSLALTAYREGHSPSTVYHGHHPAHQPSPKIALLFTGQGSQYSNMGRELYETNPTFRATVDRCDAILQEYLEESIVTILYPECEGNAQIMNRIDQTAYTQPALFTLEYALATLWQSWGIEPHLLIGHSVGELVAACIAGVFSLEDGLMLVAARGRLMQALPQDGAMVALTITEEAATAAITPYGDALSIAAINGPSSVVISGRKVCVDELAKQLESAGVKSRPLVVSHAFHSQLMTPMLAEFRQVAARIVYHRPTRRLVSNLTGTVVRDEMSTPEYWVRHVRETVRFADGVAQLERESVEIYLEVGPQPTLLGLVMGRKEAALQSRDQTQASGAERPLCQAEALPSLRQGRTDWQQMVASLGTLYVHGAEINWRGFDQGYARRKVSLPTYPFQRERYWFDPSAGSSTPASHKAPALRPLIDRMLKLPLQRQTIFESEMSLAALPFLKDHRVLDRVVAPGAGHLAMVLNAAAIAWGTQQVTLEEITFLQPLLLPEEGSLTSQLIFSPAEHRSAPMSEFQLISFGPSLDSVELQDSQLFTHATGYVDRTSASIPTQSANDLNQLRQRCSETISVDAFYAAAAARQLTFGPSFRWLDALWAGDSEALGHLRLPAIYREKSTDGYLIHPGLLDGCFQVAGATLQQTATPQSLLPFAIDALHLQQSPMADADGWWCHAIQIGQHRWNLRLMNDAGDLLVEIAGFAMREVSLAALQQQAPWHDWLYTISWQGKALFGLLPTYLTAPETLSKRGQETFEKALTDPNFSTYQQFLTALEEISVDTILALFRQAGLPFAIGSRWQLAPLIEQLRVTPTHQKLLGRFLQILVETGLLKPIEEGWQVVETPVERNPKQEIARLHTQYGDMVAAELTLLARCGEKLGAVLRGEQSPLELLFPNGDTQTLSMLYQHSPGAAVMNQLVQEAILGAIAHLPANQGLRILEIGAGTGGTTATLLPHLPVDQTDYLFTDIGVLFLAKAQETFATYPFVRYATLDIERSPLEQGFPAHQVDIVLAANVLHATADLRVTLAHIRQLLAPGGLLILLEGTKPSNWIDLTFGLTEGWWRFSDTRTAYPLLTAAGWHCLLQESGFHRVTAVPNQVTDAENALLDLGQAVLVAKANQQPTRASVPWLLFADQTGIANCLADQLGQRGEKPIMVYAGETYQQLDAESVTVNPADPIHYRRLLTHYPETKGIVHLWGLDAQAIATADDLLMASQQGCGTLLHLVQALLQHNTTTQQAAADPRLWLVTRNAHTITGDHITGDRSSSSTQRQPGFVQASLWGMGKVIALEHPELQPVCIDLDSNDSAESQAAALAAELITGLTNSPEQHEAQVALRNGVRQLARVTRYKPALQLPTEPYQLTITERGTLENLQLASTTRQLPAAGQVEIRVCATGLNFRDLFNVLGLAPGDPGLPGDECAGEVVAVGPDVEEFAIGDAVVALAAGSFRQYMTVDTQQVVHAPPNLSHAEAATIPVAFLTAYYAFHHLARIGPEDRVLIHAAAGGVGQAAIQLAQRAGAEIFCTASEGKWATLRALGVQHIYNSRSLDFGRELLADTNGAGVTIVLNSLTAPGFIEQSLSTLATDGRFVEISKREIWSDAEIAAVRPDVTPFLLDLVTVIEQQPAQIHDLLTTLMTQFEQEVLRPLPQTCFAIQDATRAFRLMQQGKHTGKIVLTHPTPTQLTIDANASYLITGGLGGLGLRTAQWLADGGARHLCLLGRSAPTSEIQPQLDALEARGVALTIVQADVTDRAQLAEALATIPPSAPLRGVIHAVGVLDDAALTQLDWQRFAKVLAPKMQGAWNLHTLTHEMALDFFVLYSSAVGFLGNQGQANHAAANAVLDAFAHYRHSQGLPALSINWGAWSEIGAAADMLRQNPQRLAAVGQHAIAPDQGIQILAYLLQQATTQVGVIPINWSQFLSLWEVVPNFFAEFTDERMADGRRHQPATNPIREQLRMANLAERKSLLVQYLRTVAANVLALPSPEAIDPAQNLTGLGLDSLMAIELKNLISRELQINIAVRALFECTTIAELAEYIEAQQAAHEMLAGNGSLANEPMSGPESAHDEGEI